jgi:hypothetical protein
MNLCWRKDVENSKQHILCNMTQLWLCIPFTNILKKLMNFFLAKNMEGFLYLTATFLLPAGYLNKLMG